MISVSNNKSKDGEIMKNRKTKDPKVTKTSSKESVDLDEVIEYKVV